MQIVALTTYIFYTPYSDIILRFSFAFNSLARRLWKVTCLFLVFAAAYMRLAPFFYAEKKKAAGRWQRHGFLLSFL
jgi:hypothetical protein